MFVSSRSVVATLQGPQGFFPASLLAVSHGQSRCHSIPFRNFLPSRPQLCTCGRVHQDSAILLGTYPAVRLDSNFLAAAAAEVPAAGGAFTLSDDARGSACSKGSHFSAQNSSAIHAACGSVLSFVCPLLSFPSGLKGSGHSCDRKAEMR